MGVLLVVVKIDEAVEERIREWIVLFNEADTRTYWTSLLARQMDAAMRMLKVGRPIERPVQTELLRLHESYTYYANTGIWDEVMSFTRFIYCKAGRMQEFYNDEY